MTRIKALFLIFCLLLPGCGYQFGTVGLELPEGVNRIYVDLFVNRTKEPYLDSILTESIIYRLAGHHNVKLVERSQDADAILAGEVVQYGLSVSAYDKNDAIEAYRVSVKVKATLVRATDDKLLWQGEAVRFDDFVSSGVGITIEEGLEQSTLRRVSERLAEDLSWQLSTGFGAE